MQALQPGGLGFTTWTRTPPVVTTEKDQIYRRNLKTVIKRTWPIAWGFIIVQHINPA